MENREAANLRTILDMWDFSDLETSAARFDDARSDALSRGDEDFAAELATQLARVRGLQRDLVEARVTAGLDPDGFVHEGLGELLLLADKDEAARDQFKIALPLLREVTWLSESDPARLDRIEALALEE